MYEQLVAPNLSVIGQPEECLVYVREVFGAPAKYPTAASGWENAQYKHAGEQPPAAAVPIWFSYNGPDGHVAVWDNGTIYSTSAQGDKTFPSIEALIEWMGEGFEYLGWSEDVDGVRVVEPEAPAPPSVSIKVNPGTWNVRSGASTGVPSLGLALGGQQYGATIQSNGWAQISFRAKTGYLGPAAYKTI